MSEITPAAKDPTSSTEMNVNTSINSADNVPPATTNLITSQKDGEGELHDQKAEDCEVNDGLDEEYSALPDLRTSKDICALEKRLADIYRKLGIEDELVALFDEPTTTPSNPQKLSVQPGHFGTNSSGTSELPATFGSTSPGTSTTTSPPLGSSNAAPTFGSPSFTSQTSSTSPPPPSFGGLKNVKMTPPTDNATPEAANNKTRTSPSNSPVQPHETHVQQAVTHKSVPMVKSNSQNKLKTKDAPKFQFVSTVNKQAPNEVVYECPAQFIEAIEKCAENFYYRIAEEWMKIVPCMFPKVDRYWLDNTLLKAKSWEETKEAIMKHPESQAAVRYQQTQLIAMKMNEDEKVAEYHERFLKGLQLCGFPNDEDASIGKIFLNGLQPNIKRLAIFKMKSDKKPVCSVNYVANIARACELIDVQSRVLAHSSKRLNDDEIVPEKPAKLQKTHFFCTKHHHNGTHDTEDCITLNRKIAARQKKQVGNPNLMIMKTPILINGEKMIARCSPELIGDSYMTLKTARILKIPVNYYENPPIRLGRQLVGRTDPLPVVHLRGLSFTQEFDVIDIGFSDSDVFLNATVLKKCNIGFSNIIVKGDRTGFERPDLKKMDLTIFTPKN